MHSATYLACVSKIWISKIHFRQSVRELVFGQVEMQCRFCLAYLLKLLAVLCRSLLRFPIVWAGLPELLQRSLMLQNRLVVVVVVVVMFNLLIFRETWEKHER